MELIVKKSYIALISALSIVEVLGYIGHVPVWLIIVMGLLITEFGFHEPIHCIVARLYGTPVVKMEFNVPKCYCRLEDEVYTTHPKIVAHICIAGFIFDCIIFMPILGLIIYNGISQNQPIFFLLAAIGGIEYIYTDFLREGCDIRRYFEYSEKRKLFIHQQST
jgi:hypothetical protein